MFFIIFYRVGYVIYGEFYKSNNVTSYVIITHNNTTVGMCLILMKDNCKIWPKTYENCAQEKHLFPSFSLTF